jgi:hypothetical protein
MKLTADEQRMVEEKRRRDIARQKEEKERKASWDREQKRLDTPGLGCLTCAKTIREVHLEGRYDSNDDRIESMGWVSLSQWTGGGAMTEKEASTLFHAELCCSCLKKMHKKFKEMEGA